MAGSRRAEARTNISLLHATPLLTKLWILSGKASHRALNPQRVRSTGIKPLWCLLLNPPGGDTPSPEPAGQGPKNWQSYGRKTRPGRCCLLGPQVNMEVHLEHSLVEFFFKRVPSFKINPELRCRWDMSDFSIWSFCLCNMVMFPVLEFLASL